MDIALNGFLVFALSYAAYKLISIVLCRQFFDLIEIIEAVLTDLRMASSFIKPVFRFFPDFENALHDRIEESRSDGCIKYRIENKFGKRRIIGWEYHYTNVDHADFLRSSIESNKTAIRAGIGGDEIELFDDRVELMYYEWWQKIKGLFSGLVGK